MGVAVGQGVLRVIRRRLAQMSMSEVPSMGAALGPGLGGELGSGPAPDTHLELT